MNFKDSLSAVMQKAIENKILTFEQSMSIMDLLNGMKYLEDEAKGIVIAPSKANKNDYINQTAFNSSVSKQRRENYKNQVVARFLELMKPKENGKMPSATSIANVIAEELQKTTPSITLILKERGVAFLGNKNRRYSKQNKTKTNKK